ncbi:gamma tubulin complex Spc97/GCP2 subunit Alp4 [Leucoagaricus gongylophorus]
MSSSTKSLAQLTSLSTQTLSLLLEHQRSQTSASLNPISQSKNYHASQITKNLQHLRTGILDLEDQDGRTGAVSLLRGQYERMRGMLGGNADGISVESLGSSAPRPPASFSSSSLDSLPRAPSPPVVFPPTPPGKNSGEFQYTPYKDDPDTNPLLEDSGLMFQQRVMMNDQDVRLDQLSQSINRQHHLSIQINDELETHSGLLQELDTDVDRTQHRLRSARRQLDRVAKGAKENSSAVAIGVIIFVLLILIIIFKT